MSLPEPSLDKSRKEANQLKPDDDKVNITWAKQRYEKNQQAFWEHQNNKDTISTNGDKTPIVSGNEIQSDFQQGEYRQFLDYEEEVEMPVSPSVEQDSPVKIQEDDDRTH